MWLLRGKGNQVNEEPSFLVAEPTPEYHEDRNDLLSDSVWKAKYEELEKRYDQLLSIYLGLWREKSKLIGVSDALLNGEGFNHHLALVAI